jgi:hypothetical protein
MDREYSPSTFGTGTHPIVKRLMRSINDRNLTRFLSKPLGTTINAGQMKGVTRMRIEFKEYESTKTNPNPAGKTFSMYRIKGKALTGKLAGQEWTTQIFASAKDMVSQVKALNEGDIVDVEMKSNGKFWNPQSFTKVEGANADISVPSPKTHTGGGTNGTAPANPRQENMKVALKAIGPMKKGESDADYMIRAGKAADMVQDYVDKKGVFQFDETVMDSGIPEVDVEEATG